MKQRKAIFGKLTAIFWGLGVSFAVLAAENPIVITQSSISSIPAETSLNGSYLVSYTLSSTLPFTMPTPLVNSYSFNPQTEQGSFTITDGCHGKKLVPGGSCVVSVGFNARTLGKKSFALNIAFGNKAIQKIINTHTKAQVYTSPDWVGLLGADYSPNHYAQGSPFNDHEVFYAGNASGTAVSNQYFELQQLQAAGYTTVRSYNLVEYPWIDLIQQANALGMKVVYEANIPAGGGQTEINAAVSVLNNVINAVGTTVFNDTVILVFAGHENYNNANINYIINAVNALKSALSSQSLSTPVGSAVVAGNFVTPSAAISADMQSLINSYSATSPLSFDPYPFQYGVTPPNQAVSLITLLNAIAWDYAKTQSQSFYQAGTTILMAETGWATQGTGQWQNYFCYQNNDCAPGVSNAAAYLQALYKFVAQASNNAGALVFEAYDEPIKNPFHADDAENFYGVFDSNCILKNASMIPNASFVPANYLACQGYSSGALLTVSEISPVAEFTVTITQTNPITGQSANINATVPAIARDLNVFPWPEYLVFDNAQFTITGSTPGNSCTGTLSVSGGLITSFSISSCTGGASCTNGNQYCLLPSNY